MEGIRQPPPSEPKPEEAKLTEDDQEDNKEDKPGQSGVNLVPTTYRPLLVDLRENLPWVRRGDVFLNQLLDASLDAKSFGASTTLTNQEMANDATLRKGRSKKKVRAPLFSSLKT